MADTAALVRPEIQAQLISDALLSARVGFLVEDDDGRIVAANDAACELLGATREELLGREIEDWPPDLFSAIFATTTAGMPFTAILVATARPPDLRSS